jgi:hypothetical protein
MLRRKSGAHRLLALLPALAAILLATGPSAHAQGGFTWVQTLTPPGPNPMGRAQSVALDSQGNVIAAGLLNEFDVGQLFTVAKYDPAGNLLWSRGLGLGLAQAVVVDRHDNVIAGGSVFGTSAKNSVVAKWDPQGTLLWTASLLPDPTVESDIAALALDSSDNVIAGGGITTLSSGLGDWAVAKFQAADGTRFWLQRGRGNPSFGNNEVDAVAVDHNDDVVAAGFIETVNGDLDFLVLKLAGATGNLLWLQDQGTPAPRQFDQAFSVVTDAQNDVIAGGYFTVTGLGQVFTVAKFDRTTGNRLWIDQLPGAPGNAIAVLIDSQGHPVAVGSTTDAVKGTVVAAVKYDDATGGRIWTTLIPGPGPTGFARGNEAVRDAQDNVVVGGSSGVSSPSFLENLTTWKLDSNGNLVWTRVLPSNGQGVGLGAAVDSQGNVAVAGSSTDPALGRVEFTVAYVDQVAPALNNCQVTPRSLPSTGGDVQISAVVTDADGVASVTATVTKPDGTKVQVPLTRQGNTNTFAGTYTAAGNPTFSLQTYHVSITAVDRTGNQAVSDCGDFTVAAAPDTTPPQLSNCQVSPSRLTGAGGLVTISVTAVDDVAVSSVNAIITRPDGSQVDVPLTAGANHLYSGTYRVAANTRGHSLTYRVLITAVDPAGNRASMPCGPIIVAGLPIRSARVRVMQSGQVVATLLLRDTGQGLRGTFPALRPGSYNVQATGFASLDGSGTPIAVAAGTAVVQAHRTAVLRLTWFILP